MNPACIPCRFPESTPIDYASIRFLKTNMEQFQRMLLVLEEEIFIFYILEGGSANDYPAVWTDERYVSLKEAIVELRQKRLTIRKMRMRTPAAARTAVHYQYDWSPNVLKWGQFFNANHTEILYRIYGRDVIVEEQNKMRKRGKTAV
jgi:hypothetical protein